MKKGQRGDKRAFASAHAHLTAVDLKLKPSNVSKNNDDDDDCYRPAISVEQQMKLKKTVKKLVVPGKGIVAIDEMDEGRKRKIQEALIVAGTSDKRKDPILAFLEGTKDLNNRVSGIIFHDSALAQLVGRTRTVRMKKWLSENDLCLGVRVDKSKQILSGTLGEVTSTGLDSLPSACERFVTMGAVFMECAFPVTLSEFTPSFLAYRHNANTAARFASICQTFGIVSIISIEIQNEASINNLDLKTSLNALQEVLATLVKTLYDHHVLIEGVILRLPPLWFPSKSLNIPHRTNSQQLALAMWMAMTRTLPASTGGIALADATNLEKSLQALNALHICPCFKPYPTTFCWGRVLSENKDELLSMPDKDICGDTKLESDHGTVVMPVPKVEQLKWELERCALACMGQFCHARGNLFVTRINTFVL